MGGKLGGRSDCNQQRRGRILQATDFLFYGTFQVRKSCFKINSRYETISKLCSKFVPRGSVRIYSSQQVFEENGTKAVAVDEYDDAKAVVKHVAFLTPTGEHVLVLINTSPVEVQRVEVKEAERTVRLELQPSAIVTAIWRA